MLLVLIKEVARVVCRPLSSSMLICTPRKSKEEILVGVYDDIVHLLCKIALD